MPNNETCTQQQVLLATHRRTLAHYLHRLALVGEANAPPEVMHGIAEARIAIHRIKETLHSWGLEVENHPDDAAPERTAEPGVAPFKGLLHFNEADADLFFGRELLTTRLIRQLCDHRSLVIVVGASGSGKSSIVRAGLIPALKSGLPLVDGTLPPPGSDHWPIHVITPDRHPLESLAASLTRDSESVTATATLMDDLIHDPRSLHLFARKLLSHSAHLDARLLLVVDQFEELFTLCQNPAERQAFVDNLLTAVVPETGGPTVVVMTLRADFYAYCAQFAGLRAVLEQYQTYIGPMNAEELRRAMEEPARRTGWEFEPGLVDLLLREAGDDPGALPLLSHALLETWRCRRGRMLTLEGYATSGGLRGAIARTADKIYADLTPEQQMIARAIFLRLTELGEGMPDARRRVRLAELLPAADRAPAVQDVLQILADARLVTTDKPGLARSDTAADARDETAEVAHEALIREWPQLREWLDEDRDDLRLHQRLSNATAEWVQSGWDASFLSSGARLAQCEALAMNSNLALNAEEQAYLEASIAERERREALERERQAHELDLQKRAANQLRYLVGALAVFLAVAIGLTAFAFNSRADAVAQRQQADANLNRSEAQRLAAEANALLQARGNAEPIALLSIRSIRTEYTPQGDAALAGAATLDYSRQLFVGHAGPVYGAAFSPDGRYVLTGSADKTVRLWNAQTNQEIRQFVGHTDAIEHVAFSPDGRTIVTSSDDKTARLWNVETGQQLHLLSSTLSIL